MSSRRQLLKAISAGLGLSALAGVATSRIVQRHGSRVRLPEFGSLHAERSAALLGVLYLARYPAERDSERLMKFVFPDSNSLEWPSLRERIRADFDSSRIVRLDGWVLSATEIRFCALTALSRGLA